MIGNNVNRFVQHRGIVHAFFEPAQDSNQPTIRVGLSHFLAERPGRIDPLNVNPVPQDSQRIYPNSFPLSGSGAFFFSGRLNSPARGHVSQWDTYTGLASRSVNSSGSIFPASVFQNSMVALHSLQCLLDLGLHPAAINSACVAGSFTARLPRCPRQTMATNPFSRTRRSQTLTPFASWTDCAPRPHAARWRRARAAREYRSWWFPGRARRTFGAPKPAARPDCASARCSAPASFYLGWFPLSRSSIARRCTSQGYFCMNTASGGRRNS